MYINFEKKDEPHSLSTWNIIDSKGRGYLNVCKVLFENTLQQTTC